MASYPRCCRCTADVKTGCAATWEGLEAGAWLWVRDATVQYNEASKSWIYLASSVWEQTEAIRVYCERCWRSWARYVKPGCKYQLSSSCEGLANSNSGKYLDHWKHRGNPFQCAVRFSVRSSDRFEIFGRLCYRVAQKAAAPSPPTYCLISAPTSARPQRITSNRASQAPTPMSQCRRTWGTTKQCFTRHRAAVAGSRRMLLDPHNHLLRAGQGQGQGGRWCVDGHFPGEDEGRGLRHRLRGHVATESEHTAPATPATTAILPKLLGRQKRLQCDVEAHSAESENLALRVADLEQEVERLKSFRRSTAVR
ncbi:rihA [Symbiodinium sp. CCMP2592]|nr:rihA [Symbiodinium sp. CCMP2592]